jgi:hypothetical protein
VVVWFRPWTYEDVRGSSPNAAERRCRCRQNCRPKSIKKIGWLRRVDQPTPLRMLGVFVGRPGSREAGIGAGCLVGGGAAVGRGPGWVGGRDGHGGGGAGRVSRQSMHAWVERYLVKGGLCRSGGPDRATEVVCPLQVSREVGIGSRAVSPASAAGVKRIRMELRKPIEGLTVPSERTINRILTRARPADAASCKGARLDMARARGWISGPAGRRSSKDSSTIPHRGQRRRHLGGRGAATVVHDV